MRPAADQRVRWSSAAYEVVKRLADTLLAASALVVLSPAFVIMGVMIKATSPGRVFYRGLRTGKHARRFRIYKFRTMVDGAERLGGPSTATRDPRVTRFGWFLRRHKLDELPQLINILSGEMSIVGPRPEVPLYTDAYAGEELMILQVRPGLTDYASLEFIELDDLLGAEDADRTFREKILPTKNALRIKYVKERSLLVDATLIAKTLSRLVLKR